MSLHVSRMVPLAMALLLLGGCNRQPKDVLGTPMTAEAAATATPEQSSTPDGLEDAGLSVLGYDEIRAIARDSAPGFDQMDGYYTMSQDGLWGLMRSDGTEVLPCQFSVPLTGCASAGLAWHALNDPSLTVERLDELNAQLQAGGDGTMCSGEHGGSSRYWYYDTDTQQVRVYGGMEVASVQDLSETDTAYGNYLPCMLGTYVDGQGDPDYYEATDPVTVVYANADGTLLNDQSYQAGNCFYDQALTAAEQNGKWLYLDQNGAAVTEAVYDATYGRYLLRLSPSERLCACLPGRAMGIAGCCRHRSGSLYLPGRCLGRRPPVAAAGGWLACLHSARCGQTDPRSHARSAGGIARHHHRS